MARNKHECNYTLARITYNGYHAEILKCITRYRKKYDSNARIRIAPKGEKINATTTFIFNEVYRQEVSYDELVEECKRKIEEIHREEILEEEESKWLDDYYNELLEEGIIVKIGDLKGESD